MARSGIVALIVVVVGNVLGGCGEDARNAAPEHHHLTRPTATQASSGPKPPYGTLTLGKHAVTGALGSPSQQHPNKPTPSWAAPTVMERT